jgi:hypothetical protein
LVAFNNIPILQPYNIPTLSEKRLCKSGGDFYFCNLQTVDVAQLVRASVCGTEGRGFEPHHLPKTLLMEMRGVFSL